MAADEHTLLSPRLGAVFGLATLSGTGIGLMASRFDVVYGALLGTFPILGMLWLYYKPIRVTISMVLITRDIRSIKPEIGVAMLIAVVMLATDLVLIFQACTYQDPMAPASRITIATVWPRQKSDNNYRWLIGYINQSDVVAKDISYIVEVKYYDSEMKTQETNDLFAALETKMTEGMFVKNSAELVHGYIQYNEPGEISSLTGAQVNLIELHRKRVFFAAILRYRDDNTPHNKNRFTYFCATDILSPTLPVLCSENNKTFTK